MSDPTSPSQGPASEPNSPPGGAGPRPHRPVPLADLDGLLGAGPDGGLSRAELASSTAAAVLDAAARAAAGSGPDSARLVSLAESVGLDTLAQLWCDSEPDTLPGALWALYLVRAWCHANGDEVARLWRAGRGMAPADEVVAGVHDDADPQALAALADAVLSGAYGSDFGVALERAAAFFRVVAAGRRAIAPDAIPLQGISSGAEPQLMLAERNDRVAAGLTRAAARWRVGQLH
jgi:hypothetical protein